MEIKEQIEKDFIWALKQRLGAEVLVLRLLKTAIKNAEIAKIGELAGEELVKLLRSEVKKRQEAILDFKKGNRLDLVKKEEAEIEVIKKYLPPELTDEKIKEIIKKVILTLKAAGPKDLGKIMGKVMSEIKGQAAGDKVRTLVAEALEQLEKK